jgi:hypothetical protein
MYTEKHLIELFKIMTIYILQKNGGTDTKAMGQTEPHFLSDPMSDRKKKFSPTLRNFYKKQHGARPCMEKMQLIFFVPPNEELEGTLHPQKFECTPKNEGKRVHVPPDEKTCGHAANMYMKQTYW